MPIRRTLEELGRAIEFCKRIANRAPAISESERLQRLFLRFAPSVAYVVTENSERQQAIGSAFHVGEGVFITARHVVQQRRVIEIALRHGLSSFADAIYGGSWDREMEELLKWSWHHTPLQLRAAPSYHPDETVDVACFVCDGVHPHTPAIPMGTHLDDWIGVKNFVLSRVLVLGYPPIPLTREPYLIAAQAEINAVVDLPTVPHVHFILSAIPRGGFSGGAVFSDYGFLLGVVTQSLLRDGVPEQLGFFTALSVEPIYTCLDAAKLLPKCQWDGC